MIRHITIAIAVSLCATRASSQQAFPVDTSYTVSGTYAKLIKNYPFIKPVHPTAPKGVEMKADVVYKVIEHTPFGKRLLHADIFIPQQNREQYPTLIMIHGGGWRAGNKSLNTPMAEQIAVDGFVVVSVEYRLSLEAKYPAGVHDIKDCIQWIRKHAKEFKTDTTHIAIAGSSAGGQLASLIGVTSNNPLFEEQTTDIKYSTAVHAVINLDGLSDFTHADNLAVPRNDYSADVFWLGGFYQDIPGKWREASPLTWTNKTAPPFLFINSSQKRFAAGYEQMVSRLKEFGVYSKVIKLEDAPHSYWLFHPWFEPTIDHMKSFLHDVFHDKRD